MFTLEWEFPHFNRGSTFSHAELASLMVPRPFMVERGRHDAVALDSEVASEFAKVRWLCDQFGLGDWIGMEGFSGGHCINAQETFRFLHGHLTWPDPRQAPGLSGPTRRDQFFASGHTTLLPFFALRRTPPCGGDTVC